MRRWLRDQRGFTLIELMVVIIVLGLLVGLVGPRLFGRVGQSKQAAAKAQIELLGAGLDQFRLDIGSYPNTSQGLDALQRNPGAQNWNGPYLKKAVPKDPWGNPYKYRAPGQHGIGAKASRRGRTGRPPCARSPARRGRAARGATRGRGGALRGWRTSIAI